MTERSTQHATFVIDRNYDASPAQVFAAWAWLKKVLTSVDFVNRHSS